MYRWKTAKRGEAVDPPPSRFELAVQEAFYWAEQLDNGSSFADQGVSPSPGTIAALTGFWRGRNRADNEAMQTASEKASAARPKQEQKKAARERYKNGD